ncbi:hypothetical protein ACLOJK_001636 [Asimina triloba]
MVSALGVLQQQFEKLQEWRGDPCLPATFNWEWVACSSDPTPRITALIATQLLSGLQLKGPLPDFSAMDALQTIVSGNPNLCTSGKTCTSSDPGTGTSNGASFEPSSSSDGASTLPSSGKKKKKKKKKNTLPVLLGTLMPSFSVFSAIVGFVVFKCRHRKPAGQMNTPNKPGQTAATANAMPGSTAQVHNLNIGQSPIGAHQHQQQAAAANDSVIDISHQMASELHDLFQQQEQATDQQDNNPQ